jgi:hypothetical protein
LLAFYSASAGGGSACFRLNQRGGVRAFLVCLLSKVCLTGQILVMQTLQCNTGEEIFYYVDMKKPALGGLMR